MGQHGPSISVHIGTGPNVNDLLAWAKCCYECIGDGLQELGISKLLEKPLKYYVIFMFRMYWVSKFILQL